MIESVLTVPGGEQRLKYLSNSMPFSSPCVCRPAELKEQRECLP